MMTTCLSLAVMNSASPATSSPSQRLFCCGRNSIAKWMPLSSRPGIGRSRADRSRRRRARSRRTRAAASPRSTSTPTFAAGLERRRPSASICCEAAIEDRLLHLEVGDAVAEQAADAVGALEHRDAVAGLVQLLGRGEARRARADDRHASCRCATAGGCGVTQPSSNARSMIAYSIDLIVTGSSLMPRTQAPSHGRRAEAAGELGEVVGRVQPRRAPPASDRGRRGRSSPG